MLPKFEVIDKYRKLRRNSERHHQKDLNIYEKHKLDAGNLLMGLFIRGNPAIIRQNEPILKLPHAKPIDPNKLNLRHPSPLRKTRPRSSLRSVIYI